MNINELKEFLLEKVPNFENPKIIENGECYHYTIHWDKIKKDGKFKGAKINEDLDRTQRINENGIADQDLGVVFGYPTIENARFEGNNTEIIKVIFRKAISSIHKDESDIPKQIINHYKSQGIHINPEELPIPPSTILFLTTDIISFEYIEKNK